MANNFSTEKKVMAVAMLAEDNSIRSIEQTIHRCKAVHFASETVIELFRGEVAWDGVVETFTYRPSKGQALPRLELRRKWRNSIRHRVRNSARELNGNGDKGSNCSL